MNVSDTHLNRKTFLSSCNIRYSPEMLRVVCDLLPNVVVRIEKKFMWVEQRVINPLNAELNPICHLLTLLGAHHIFHVSRIRVKF